MPSNGFLIKDAKFLLLTYSQVPVLVQQELPMRIVLLASERGAECLVGREQHEDGGIHYHAFIDFGGRRYSTRDPRSWDLEGIHPNIEKGGRTPWKIYDYVGKEGDIVAGGATRPEQTGRDRGDQQDDWIYICSATTKDEFYSRVGERRPKDLVCSFGNIAKYADWAYRSLPVEYQNPPDRQFELEGHDNLCNWVDEHLRGADPR